MTVVTTNQTLPLRVGAQTHPGYVRGDNQDALASWLTAWGRLFLVADGMGGHEGGALAARLVCEGLARHLKELPQTLGPAEALRQAAQKVNAEIYRRARSGEAGVAGMGSTLVLALVQGTRLSVGHAGDSRAYLYRQQQLQPLTRDHSPIQQMLDNGLLTPAEAREHPDANLINRAFGQAPTLELEVSEHSLRPGDGVLLCSDGLCGYLSDDAITRALAAGGAPQVTANALIELALSVGGEDNVTVQWLVFSQPEPKPAVKTSVPTPLAASEISPLKFPRWRSWLPATVAVFCVALVGGAMWYFFWPRAAVSESGPPSVPGQLPAFPTPTPTPVKKSEPPSVIAKPGSKRPSPATQEAPAPTRPAQPPPAPAAQTPPAPPVVATATPTPKVEVKETPTPTPVPSPGNGVTRERKTSVSGRAEGSLEVTAELPGALAQGAKSTAQKAVKKTKQTLRKAKKVVKQDD